MAMKKRAGAPQKRPQNATDDTVVYRVMIAMAIGCLLILAVQLTRRYYATAAYFAPIRAALCRVAAVSAALALAGLILWAVLRKKSAFFRLAGLPLFCTFILICCGAFLLYRYWVSAAPAVYFLIIAAVVLYLIRQLYQREFFVISLLTILAGGTFYLLSRLYASGVVTPTAILVNLPLAVLSVLAALLAAFAARHDGAVRLGKRETRVFRAGFSPLYLYITSAVWLVCLIAGVLLGSVFVYYCMFAAAGFELVAACYYTVKLA